MALWLWALEGRRATRSAYNIFIYYIFYMHLFTLDEVLALRRNDLLRIGGQGEHTITPFLRRWPCRRWWDRHAHSQTGTQAKFEQKFSLYFERITFHIFAGWTAQWREDPGSEGSAADLSIFRCANL